MAEIVKRKPKARHKDVVIGCMEERLGMIFENQDHVARLRELLDELKRSLSKDKDDE